MNLRVAYGRNSNTLQSRMNLLVKREAITKNLNTQQTIISEQGSALQKRLKLLQEAIVIGNKEGVVKPPLAPKAKPEIKTKGNVETVSFKERNEGTVDVNQILLEKRTQMLEDDLKKKGQEIVDSINLEKAKAQAKAMFDMKRIKVKKTVAEQLKTKINERKENQMMKLEETKQRVNQAQKMRLKEIDDALEEAQKATLKQQRENSTASSDVVVNVMTEVDNLENETGSKRVKFAQVEDALLSVEDPEPNVGGNNHNDRQALEELHLQNLDNKDDVNVDLFLEKIDEELADIDKLTQEKHTRDKQERDQVQLTVENVKQNLIQLPPVEEEEKEEEPPRRIKEIRQQPKSWVDNIQETQQEEEKEEEPRRIQPIPVQEEKEEEKEDVKPTSKETPAQANIRRENQYRKELKDEILSTSSGREYGNLVYYPSKKDVVFFKHKRSRTNPIEKSHFVLPRKNFKTVQELMKLHESKKYDEFTKLHKSTSKAEGAEIARNFIKIHNSSRNVGRPTKAISEMKRYYRIGDKFKGTPDFIPPLITPLKLDQRQKRKKLKVSKRVGAGVKTQIKKPKPAIGAKTKREIIKRLGNKRAKIMKIEKADETITDLLQTNEQLKNKFIILVGSLKSGNKSKELRDNIIDMSDEMLKRKLITKKVHKDLNKEMKNFIK